MSKFILCFLLFAAAFAGASEMDLIAKRMREAEFPAADRLLSEAVVRNWLEKQQPDGSFSDIDYLTHNRSNWPAAAHAGRTRNLARVWADPRHPAYRAPAVGRAVTSAFAWWAENRPQNTNWWWMRMHLPQVFGTALLLAPELCPPGPVRERMLELCRQSQFESYDTGDNRLFCAGNLFRLALIENDGQAAAENAAVIRREITVVPTQNRPGWAFGGARSDGSYHQHGPQIQFGNYGGNFLNAVSLWANFWKDTEFELKPAQWEVMRRLAFDGFQWVLWRGYMDQLAIGRQLGKEMCARKGAAAVDAIERLAQADPGGSVPYRAIADANRRGENGLVGNRHFWQSDYMVHRRPAWYASFRGNSVRVRPLEDDVNHDNPLGRYLSDGGFRIMLRGDEYENLAASWNWTRLPGTTCAARPVLSAEECAKLDFKIGGENPRFSFGFPPRQLGETEFDGGVSDGVRGAAVFTQDVDGVKAKKAAFFDADAVVLLGSSITSTSDYPVATTVNTAVSRGEIVRSKDWIWHDGVGYRGENLQPKQVKRQGDWRFVIGGATTPMPDEKELFELVIEHGTKCRDASYAVWIVPGVEPEAMEKVRLPEVIANTADLQAVRFVDGTVAAIFHAPGKLGAFSTATPGVFLIGDKIHAADPTAKLEKMVINGQKAGTPTGENAGRTFCVPQTK